MIPVFPSNLQLAYKKPQRTSSLASSSCFSIFATICFFSSEKQLWRYQCNCGLAMRNIQYFKISLQVRTYSRDSLCDINTYYNSHICKLKERERMENAWSLLPFFPVLASSESSYLCSRCMSFALAGTCWLCTNSREKAYIRAKWINICI